MGQLPDTDLLFMDVNALSGAETAVKHLIELGHQNIGMITNAPLSYTSAHQRCTRYRQALQAEDLNSDND
jgi:DNA-binding LacI/PurR family transcriptional regulator